MSELTTGNLPQDGHVHSQFSWDTLRGDLAATCAQAQRIGLRSLAFTEHVDFTPWNKNGIEIPASYRGHVGGDGRFLAAPLDVEAYLAEIDRCRSAFPDLRILSGIELSEGDRHPDQVQDLLGRGTFDRVVGSVHALDDLGQTPSAAGPADSAGPPDSADFAWQVEVSDAYAQRGGLDVVRGYLARVADMAASDAPFGVLGHIDYPLRHWPQRQGPVAAWYAVEDEARAALEVLAGSGRLLEVNTRLPLAPVVVRWWHEVGGEGVVFGSDAHEPDLLAHAFVETAAMVGENGFRSGPTPYEPWGRA